MHFEEGEVYHIYNRGNDKQRIFFNEENYFYILKKIRREWCPFCDILCYCLMPNHFHLMVIPNSAGCEELTIGEKSSHLQILSKTIGKTLSSYTKAINLVTCFYYIHLNPLKANLVRDLRDWAFSSWLDYAGLRDGDVCNKAKLFELSGLSREDCQIETHSLDKQIIDHLF